MTMIELHEQPVIVPINAQSELVFSKRIFGERFPEERFSSFVGRPSSVCCPIGRWLIPSRQKTTDFLLPSPTETSIKRNFQAEVEEGVWTRSKLNVQNAEAELLDRVDPSSSGRWRIVYVP
jgi:hypothetical protein